MRILSVDYGVARTGIAICDETEVLATPLYSIPSYNEQKLLSELLTVIKDQKAELIIVGKPLRTDGKNSEIALKAERFARILQEESGVDVQLYDERFTTVIASKKLHANEKSTKKQRSLIDAAAAAVLLQDFIDKRHRKK